VAAKTAHLTIWDFLLVVVVAAAAVIVAATNTHKHSETLLPQLERCSRIFLI
jgi:hypothetical protein